MQVIDALFKYFLKGNFNKIIKLKNIHLNESCYIFGDGVSIKYFDLNKFSNFTSISSGKIYLHNDFSKLKCKYVVSCDPLWLTPFFLSIKNKYGSDPLSKNRKFLKYDPLSNHLKNFIIQHQDINFITDISSLLFNYSKNIFHISKYAKQFPLNNLFFELNSHNYFGQTLPTSICLAIYLGFTNIYLVGCDYTHFPSRNSHWFENQVPNLYYKKHIDYMKSFFDNAKEFVNIKTITLDGSSKNIKYETYEKFTNSKTKYKNNNELLTKENLNILSTSNWFGYKT